MSSVKIKCIVTGAEKRFSKAALQRKLLKFGTIEVFSKYYICKEAIKLLKTGKSVDDVRKFLNSNITSKVDVEILYKLKLIKSSKKKKTKSLEEIKAIRLQSEENEKKYYELKERMKTCTKTWVEEMTGGPNRCQVSYGGTCLRPDIYYDNEGNREGRCKPCPYHQYCLCTNKEVV